MKPTDLALIRTPSSPTLSPDGTAVAVAVTRIDLDEDEYRSSIWIVPTDGADRPRQVTRGSHDGSPCWSPDGRWLAFLRGGKGEPGQLHVMPTDGGEPRRVGEHPLGVSDLAWSPDSGRIAYLAQVPEPGRYERGDKARPADKEAPRRITSLRYRYDNVGFILDRPNQLFVVDPFDEDAEPRQLTHEDWQFAAPTWSPDGAWLVVATPHTADELSLAGDLYAVSAGGGDLRRLTRSETTVGRSAFAPDGATVYYLGSERLDMAGRTDGLFRVPFDGSAAPVRLTDAERWNLDDSHSVARLHATADGLVTLAARRGSVDVVRVPYGGGEPVVLGEGPHMVTDVTVAGGTIAAVLTTGTSAGEVAVLRGGTWQWRSDFGGELARTVALRPMAELTTTAPDGYPVHGWVVKPAGTGPHPVILAIHGGPFTQYGHILFDEAQVYAGAGYAVVLGNPRGASGYGEEHGRAIVGAMGTVDRDDLLALLDKALEDEELDGSRVGVMGGSYGGFMTTWLAAHDGDRFRAAISERAVNAWDSFTGSSDIGWFFTRIYCGDDPEAVRRQDPLAHADRIELPMLIIHSEHDWRCPVEQAQRLFVALKLRGVPTELLLFPGEGHELSRSGLPSHRMARFEAILEWWARHLKPAG